MYIQDTHFFPRLLLAHWDFILMYILSNATNISNVKTQG